jgi:hypothetical protein
MKYLTRALIAGAALVALTGTARAQSPLNLLQQAAQMGYAIGQMHTQPSCACQPSCYFPPQRSEPPSAIQQWVDQQRAQQAIREQQVQREQLADREWGEQHALEPNAPPDVQQPAMQPDDMPPQPDGQSEMSR